MVMISIPTFQTRFNYDTLTRGHPVQKSVQEPFWGAWLQVGDKVDYMVENEDEFRKCDVSLRRLGEWGGSVVIALVLFFISLFPL
jgi:hypothetical protein